MRAIRASYGARQALTDGIRAALVAGSVLVPASLAAAPAASPALAAPVAALAPAVAGAPGSAPAQTGTSPDSQRRSVPVSLLQLQDGWLSADAVVVGTYTGVDSALGPRYHAAQVEAVWMGTAAKGRLAFKAPRGARARRGDQVILMLWDRLNGAPDSYLEESKTRFGENSWASIGPDSLASFILPFSSYAYPLDKGKLVLQGAGAFPTEVKLGDLHRELLDFETTLQPQNLFKSADTVLRASVKSVDKLTEKRLDIVVEHWIDAHLLAQETWKGTAPDTLQLRYASFPRSPRFEKGEEVILFLSRSADGKLYLAEGKRAVFHVSHGKVEETRQAVAEFRKSLRAF